MSIQEVMGKYNLTQWEFGKITDTHPSILSKYLNGKISPTIKTLTRMAEALQKEGYKVDVKDLV